MPEDDSISEHPHGTPEASDDAYDELIFKPLSRAMDYARNHYVKERGVVRPSESYILNYLQQNEPKLYKSYLKNKSLDRRVYVRIQQQYRNELQTQKSGILRRKSGIQYRQQQSKDRRVYSNKFKNVYSGSSYGSNYFYKPSTYSNQDFLKTTNYSYYSQLTSPPKIQKQWDSPGFVEQDIGGPFTQYKTDTGSFTSSHSKLSNYQGYDPNPLLGQWHQIRSVQPIIRTNIPGKVYLSSRTKSKGRIPGVVNKVFSKPTSDKQLNRHVDFNKYRTTLPDMELANIPILSQYGNRKIQIRQRFSPSPSAPPLPPPRKPTNYVTSIPSAPPPPPPKRNTQYVTSLPAPSPPPPPPPSRLQFQQRTSGGFPSGHPIVPSNYNIFQLKSSSKPLGVPETNWIYGRRLWRYKYYKNKKLMRLRRRSRRRSFRH